eukprot:6214351-Pleurochrysis_carterae.AAC.3
MAMVVAARRDTLVDDETGHLLWLLLSSQCLSILMKKSISRHALRRSNLQPAALFDVSMRSG